MEIILQSVLAALDYSTMQSLANDVLKEFKNKVIVGSSFTQSDAPLASKTLIYKCHKIFWLSGSILMINLIIFCGYI